MPARVSLRSTSHSRVSRASHVATRHSPGQLRSRTYRYKCRFAMYCTTPSGTRYQTGIPAPTRSRQSVDEIAIAGTCTRLTVAGRQVVVEEREPGPGHADEVGQVEELVGVLPGQDLVQRVGAGDEEQVDLRARTTPADRAECPQCTSGRPGRCRPG